MSDNILTKKDFTITLTKKIWSLMRYFTKCGLMRVDKCPVFGREFYPQIQIILYQTFSVILLATEVSLLNYLFIHTQPHQGKITEII